MLYGKRHENTALQCISSFLPEKAVSALKKCSLHEQLSISELRLHRNSSITVTISGRTLFLTKDGIKKDDINGVKTSETELEKFLYRLCGGSVYAYENTIKNGFVSVHGIRTGICGEVTVKGNEITGFSGIWGLNIRLPIHVGGSADTLVNHISRHGFRGCAGILVASAPGVGKTTVLRDLSLQLASGIPSFAKNEKRFWRVCIIDERSEIYIPHVFKDTPVDFYGGIPKNKGIEFAMRVMSPEVIICDEIGSETDAALIRNAHSGGIALVASVHADSVKDILSKPELRRLCTDGIFSHIYLLRRSDNGINGVLIPVSDFLKDGTA